MQKQIETLNHLHDMAHHMGLWFIKDKTEVYHREKYYAPDIFTWQSQKHPVYPPPSRDDLPRPCLGMHTPHMRRPPGRW